MRQLLRGGRVAALLPALLLLLATASSASAHVTEASGPFRVELGWGDEPPLAGQHNSVEVGVADSAGRAVEVPAGALSVEVAFGDAAVTLPLVPDEQPDELSAAIVPARPGTYSFRVTGTVQGQTLDVSASCSEATFECVGESSDVEFPVKDPSTGELAQRLTRESARVAQAQDDADSARSVAIGALAVAVLALGLAASLGSVVAGRRKRGRP